MWSCSVTFYFLFVSVCVGNGYIEAKELDGFLFDLFEARYRVSIMDISVSLGCEATIL